MPKKGKWMGKELVLAADLVHIDDLQCLAVHCFLCGGGNLGKEVELCFLMTISSLLTRGVKSKSI